MEGWCYASVRSREGLSAPLEGYAERRCLPALEVLGVAKKRRVTLFHRGSDASFDRSEEEFPTKKRDFYYLSHKNVDALLDGDYSRLVCLTTLHFTYFQLVVAIHSAAFRLPTLEDQEGVEAGDIGPSLALCVSASRAAISLLNYHQIEHPYTPYLLYQIAWSVDILFVNILQNKNNPRARRDLDLIRTVISFFEKYDPYHQSVISYQIIKVIADVAATVLANTPTLPPHMLPVPQVPLPTPSMPMMPGSAGAMQGAFSPQMPGPGTARSGSINGSTPDVLGPMTSLSMADQQQQQTSPFMDMSAGLASPNDGQLFPGFMDMADWRLPMDYQPELWQYDNLLDNRFPNNQN